MGGPAPPHPLGPGYGVSDGIQHKIASESGGFDMRPKEDMKPKVVISAAPVITKPKVEKKKKKEKKTKSADSEVPEETPTVTPTVQVPKVVAGPALPAEFQIEEAAPMETEVEDSSKKKKDKKKKIVRTAAGVVWEDPSLEEWDPGR